MHEVLRMSFKVRMDGWIKPYSIFVGDNTVQSLTSPVLFFEGAHHPHNDLKLGALYGCKSSVRYKQEFVIAYFLSL